jgi:hypothetical protein
MSAASGTLEAAMGALVDTAGFKSQLGLTGVKLSGGATKAKITSSATMSGRSIGLSGLYYSKAPIAASKASPLAADIETVPAASLE